MSLQRLYGIGSTTCGDSVHLSVESLTLTLTSRTWTSRNDWWRETLKRSSSDHNSRFVRRTTSSLFLWTLLFQTFYYRLLTFTKILLSVTSSTLVPWRAQSKSTSTLKSKTFVPVSYVTVWQMCPSTESKECCQRQALRGWLRERLWCEVRHLIYGSLRPYPSVRRLHLHQLRGFHQNRDNWSLHLKWIVIRSNSDPYCFISMDIFTSFPWHSHDTRQIKSVLDEFLGCPTDRVTTPTNVPKNSSQ